MYKISVLESGKYDGVYGVFENLGNCWMYIRSEMLDRCVLVGSELDLFFCIGYVVD